LTGGRAVNWRGWLPSTTGVSITIFMASSSNSGEKLFSGRGQFLTFQIVLVHHDRDLYDLTVRAVGRTAVIDTTSSHLF